MEDPFDIASDCEAYNAIDFSLYLKRETTVTDVITAAVKDHLEATHKVAPTKVAICEAIMIWKGDHDDHGSNLLDMKDDAARTQLELALARGCVDHLHIEYTAEIPSRTKSTRR
jgi:hypothetical protein